MRRRRRWVGAWWMHGVMTDGCIQKRSLGYFYSSSELVNIIISPRYDISYHRGTPPTYTWSSKYYFWRVIHVRSPLLVGNGMTYSKCPWLDWNQQSCNWCLKVAYHMVWWWFNTNAILNHWSMRLSYSMMKHTMLMGNSHILNNFYQYPNWGSTDGNQRTSDRCSLSLDHII